MNSLSPALAGLSLSLALVAALGHASAQTTPPANAALQKKEMTTGDPARWYQEDGSVDAKVHSLRKEIAAAYQEASIACKQGPPDDRTRCIKDARATFQQDMANAKQIVKQHNPQ